MWVPCVRPTSVATIDAENELKMRGTEGNADNAARTSTSNPDSAPCSPPNLVARGTTGVPATGTVQAHKPQSSAEANCGSASSEAHVTMLQRQLEILKAEKATLLGELQRQKGIQCQQAQVRTRKH